MNFCICSLKKKKAETAISLCTNCRMVSGEKKRTSPIDMAPLPFPTIATESTQLKIKPPAAQKKKQHMERSLGIPISFHRCSGLKLNIQKTKAL